MAPRLSLFSFPKTPGRLVALSAFAAGLLLSTAPAHAADLSEKDVEAIVERVLMERPEIIINAVEKYREQEKAAEEEMRGAAIATSTEAFDADETIPVGGNAKGDVTVYEFFDYNCTYCKKVTGDLMAAIKKDGNTAIRFIEFPILAESSFEAARAALAAKRQGKYTEFHVALMELSGRLSSDRIMEVAKKAGLDTDQLKKDMEDEAISAHLKRNVELARLIGVTGTPAFIIGDHFVPGAIKQNMITDLIETARKNDG